MQYHIWTVGCQMNQADSQKLAAGLDRLGWSEVAQPEEADLVVLNTCSIRDHAEQRAISKLGTLKKLRGRGSAFTLAVMGCMVGPKTDELRRRFPEVDVFARPQQFEPIMEALGYDDLGGEFWPATFTTPGGPAAYVPIIHGCDKFCTYCIVPYRRGRERSRTIDDVRAEVGHLAARGVREVTLLGQTVEAYGHDLPDQPDLGDLLRAVHDIDDIARLRFLTSYPKDMTERIIEAVAALPKVCEYFNIPVQSGDNAVLERMRRGYRIEEYLEKVALIRRYMPDVAITTDVIVGFCGETEEEFRHTYELLEAVQFDKVHVAAYSPRPGTIAERKLPDDVPQEAKMARLHAVEQLEAAISARINSRLLGQELEVLVEGHKPRPRIPGPEPVEGPIALRHPEGSRVPPKQEPEGTDLRGQEGLALTQRRIAPPFRVSASTGEGRSLAVAREPEARPERSRRGPALTSPPPALAPYGRTRTNKLVHLMGPATAGRDAHAGDLVTVRIERTSPWSLAGTAAGAPVGA